MRSHLLTGCVLLLAWGLAPGSRGQISNPNLQLERTDVMVRMRDGVQLHTAIYAPKGTHEPLPIILIRTPYGIAKVGEYFDGYKEDLGLSAGYLRELAEEGYLFVFQDIRGRHGSEGSFAIELPLGQQRNNRETDEGTDTYDTIEWLVANVPSNNGRVGMTGISYPGWLTVMGMINPHPALKAVSPQASPSDAWMGDDDHHNGAFRLGYNFEYVFEMETSKENADASTIMDRYDTFQWYLALGRLSNANTKYFHSKLPTWENYIRHPDYDAYWKSKEVTHQLTRLTVPCLSVAGWWDPEDFYGPIKIYQALEKHDTQGFNYLIVGPWNHGGWARTSGRTLGEIDFGSNTAESFRHMQAKWFAYWLKDKGKLDFPKVLTFEAGSNRWREWETWPPKSGTETKRLYLGSNGKLLLEEPAKGTAPGGVRRGNSETAASAGRDYEEYISEPAHPVPYRHRPIQVTYSSHGSGWRTWLVEDQRFVADRPDVLSWESEPLTTDVTVAGEVLAKIFASTSGTDSDWVVKLIDVYPENYPDNWKLGGWQLMVSNEVFRGRYRNSFEKPEAIRSNAVLPYSIDLHTQNYTFKKTHRIMVQIQSSWFPLYDRNPQKYVPNIFEAKDSDYQKATQRIYHSTKYPSHLSIQVLSKNP